MKLWNILGASASLFLLVSTSAQAAFVTTQTGVNVTQRSCSAVGEPGYMSQWAPVIAQFGRDYGRGMPSNEADVTAEHACIFNTQWQQYFQEGEEGLGSRMTQQVVSTNELQAFLQNADGDIWLSAELDDSALTLPEAHFVVAADAFERNSANLFSYQEYEWSGEATTLTFTADIHFLMSNGLWDGANDSAYSLLIGAYQGLEIAAEALFPSNFGTALASASYSSRNDADIAADADTYRNISISFDVENGDRFGLTALSQAFALNGGYVDFANSLYTQLSVEGLSDQDSQQVFSGALQRVTVPEPSVLSLFGLALAGLFIRRRRA
ncbi:PEP-CTERM sorting domain-containing protein [Aestuariibacter halophilus]|uniref:PEP-CTERM sorting domain-containing protein n=1 Tax=Fluctibacter halophilus TaxID=226011 RepID=A0ABS8G9T9_9ALTE|nr:PEP-CTERM sorting domain-containing protein [Aestuariibacter halophilus]MCC2616881.1 PEP-CTERM sorting domain-containing protein [Aestuariibacter halophilus]